jgi:hypothetical protein
MGSVSHWFGEDAGRHRIEPKLAHSAQHLEDNDNLPEPHSRGELWSAARRARLKQLSKRYDVRAISPREMVSLSLDLYVGGFLTKAQYAELAFQPELLPSFDRTIGALTGEFAEPDRRRDFTEVWRQRLAFEARHFADEPRIIARSRKILDLLKSI